MVVVKRVFQRLLKEVVVPHVEKQIIFSRKIQNLIFIEIKPPIAKPIVPPIPVVRQTVFSREEVQFEYTREIPRKLFNREHEERVFYEMKPCE